MSIVDEYLAAEAAGQFRAIRRRALRHIHDGGDIRLFVPFHHAGNDFSVVGLAFGRPRRRPDILICPPDPLDRIAVVATLTPFVDALLGWVDTHPVTQLTSAAGRPYFAAAASPQLFVPSEGSKTAIDNWSYFLRHVPDDWSNAARLQRAGWELSALVEAAEWPGQSTLVALTRMLAEHWALGLSTTETESLAAAVALVKATPAGLGWKQLRAAEEVTTGPLGDPGTFDDIAYRNARRRARTAHPDVIATVEAAWRVATEAWELVAALPEAPSAHPAHSEAVADWAGRVGPGRTRGRWARRAVPPLGRSAQRLGRLEEAQESLLSRQAESDVLVAAELAGEGDAVLADHVHIDVTSHNRKYTVDITVAASQLRVPEMGTHLLVAGPAKRVVGVVTDVVGSPGAWELVLTIRANLGQCTGINTAKTLFPSDVVWLVPPPPRYRPPLQMPSGSPATHPGSIVQWTPVGTDPNAPDGTDVLDDGGLAQGAGNA